MKIVSWTLAGPGTAPIIGEALRSVAPVVDACMVVFTGADEQDDGDLWSVALNALSPSSENETFEWRQWSWRDDYAAARNAALNFAAETSCDWSTMVDTDERVICSDPDAFRAWLATLPAHVQVVLVHHEDGSHTRERFFWMPARYKFVGRTHEMLPCPENEQVIAPPELILWSELPKTREQLRAKFYRDVAMLREDIRESPGAGAARYYLGVSLQSLGLYAREDGREGDAREFFESAIAAYREHVRTDTSGAPAWHEGTAFSCYRAAECYLALGEPNRAIDCALAGLALDAGIAELYWIASIANLREGRIEQARAWAEGAKVHAKGSASERRRKGFRIPRGLTTGPDEVLAAVASAQTIEGTTDFVPG